MSTPRAVVGAMTHAVSNRSPDAVKHHLRARLPQLAVVAWAGFWAWFLVADSLDHYRTEGDGFAVAVMAIGLATLGSLVAATWASARLGSILLVGFGIFVLWFFQGGVAVMFLALPPLVLGAVIRARHRPIAEPTGDNVDE